MVTLVIQVLSPILRAPIASNYCIPSYALNSEKQLLVKKKFSKKNEIIFRQNYLANI